MDTDTQIVRKKTAWQHLTYWKLAITKCTGKAFIAVLLSVAQALNGVEWSSFTPTQKFICIVISLGAGWTIIDAFLDSTMAQLRKDEGIKTEVATTSTAVVKTEP